MVHEDDEALSVVRQSQGHTAAKREPMQAPRSLLVVDHHLLEPFPPANPNSDEDPDMSLRHDVVFLFDVDNTLLDNDRVTADLKRHLTGAFGPERAEWYWATFEELRAELGYADYLGALQRFRVEHPRDPNLLAVSTYLVNYPFANRLYPGSLDVIDRFRPWGPVVILSDGDVVFQPRKVERSGLGDAVDGNVLIYIHKEEMLDDVEARYPARHYVMVDDKVRILDEMRKAWGRRLTTVFPRQGHYALDEALCSRHGPPDITVERIGDLVELELADLLGPAAADVA
jgi:FMN phosphatase YigB (HAD superfamily)